MKADLEQIKKLETELRKLSKTGLTYATKFSLNRLAFDTSLEGKKQVGKQFIERNKWTRGSIQYRKTMGKTVDQMYSEAGSTEKYMAKQEEGFQTKEPVIPTPAAANQPKAKIRTKKVAKKHLMNAIKLSRKSKTGNTAHRVREAIKAGQKHVYITPSTDHFHRKRGIYSILGGKKLGNRWPKGAKLRLVYNLDKKSTVTKPTYWLSKAANRAGKLDNWQKIYAEELQKQIDLAQQKIRN